MQRLAYDTETKPNGSIFAYSTCDEDGHTVVYRLGREPEFVERLEELFSGRYRLVIHNARFDILLVQRFFGREVWRDVSFDDTMVLAHVLRNDHYSHALEDLAYDWFHYPKIDSEVSSAAKEAGGYHRVDPELMDRYQRCDVERTMLLLLFMEKRLQEDPAWKDCYLVELEVIRSALRMHNRGVRIDVEETQRLMHEIEAECFRARKRLEKRTWTGFNPGSPKDKQKLLYEQWELPVTVKTKKTGAPKVGKEVLLPLYRGEIEYPKVDLEVVADIIKYTAWRPARKILQSYCDCADENGILHPEFRTCASITGRQSCANPNLLNVPKESGVQLNPFPVPARRCFPPKPGMFNVYVDFSGIELRLLVHYSEEEELLECIRAGRDPHLLGAETLYPHFPRTKGEERKRLRSAGKNGTFAIGYGAGPPKLAQTLGIPLEEGEAAWNRYRDRFPRLTGLGKRIAAQVKRDGFVTTTFGRRIHIPRSEARVGVNYLIQGTAAEIMKRAQVSIDDLHDRDWPQCGLILVIHDEAVIEAPQEISGEFPDYARDVRRVMTRFDQFLVPLDVEVQFTFSRWTEKRKARCG